MNDNKQQNHEIKDTEDDEFFMPEDDELSEVPDNKIVVIGLGGGGCNTVHYMLKEGINEGLTGVEFFALNTDVKHLREIKINGLTRKQLGPDLTRGKGAGADPVIGEKAAKESQKMIEEIINGADLLFITAGMGGGTGTGAMPVVAEIAKEKGILAIAVVTTPFDFENRKHIAETGLEKLKPLVDSLIVINNERVKEIKKQVNIVTAFSEVDKILCYAVDSIVATVNSRSENDKIDKSIGVDMADVKKIMSQQGYAVMGTSKFMNYKDGLGAVKDIMNNPLLRDIKVKDLKGVIMCMHAGNDMSVELVEEIANKVREYTNDKVTLIWGMKLSDKYQGTVKLTLIGTGISYINSIKGDDQLIKIPSIDSKNKEDNSIKTKKNDLFSKSINEKEISTNEDYSTRSFPESDDKKELNSPVDIFKYFKD